MKTTLAWWTLSICTSLVYSRNVPSNVQSFYDRIKTGSCTGANILKSGFYSVQGEAKDFAYCKDSSTGVIYLHGTGSSNSNFANMDVDCDGDQSDPGDGRCGNSGDTQSETAFKSQVQQYSNHTVLDLNANFVPYVVFGNQGSKPGYTTFHPKTYGIKALSVMAVVCGDKLIYGVWGDTNGDDGPPLVGEASIALATACFGTSITGNNGHDQNDVLYVAFPGTVDDTVEKDADWSAKNYNDFEASISSVGNKLVEALH